VAGWVRVARAEEVESGTAKRVEVDGEEIAIVNLRGEFYAISDVCSHEYASLSEGWVDEEDETIECPLHGSRFNVKTGEVLSLPAVYPIKTYELKVEDGDIYVKVDTPE
jgi:3-phenylpropionate/trans-cinnamate dioxygenase ferredoxin subunit